MPLRCALFAPLFVWQVLQTINPPGPASWSSGAPCGSPCAIRVGPGVLSPWQSVQLLAPTFHCAVLPPEGLWHSALSHVGLKGDRPGRCRYPARAALTVASSCVATDLSASVVVPLMCVVSPAPSTAWQSAQATIPPAPKCTPLSCVSDPLPCAVFSALVAVVVGAQ